MITATIKPLNPKSPDQKYMGNEPVWPHDPGMSRMTAIGRAWTWYNYYYGKKDVKQMILAWLNHQGRHTEHKMFARVPELGLVNVTGWLCRMNMCGLELEERELSHINADIANQIEAAKSVKDTVAQAKDVILRPNIQDRLREKMQEAAAELEGMFDEFIMTGCKMSATFKPMAVIRGMNVAPPLVPEIIDTWQTRLEQYSQLLDARDPQLMEAYSNFTKVQIRNVIKFVELVIADCHSYVQVKKIERKPRSKKARPPEMVARAFKILPADPELALKSEPAARLVNASEAWLYDVKKRKLIHAVADSHVGSFTVKGSALIGLDAGQTLQKTLRRPAEQLKSLMTASVPNARKLFRDIKATETKWNGRGNANLVILRTK